MGAYHIKWSHQRKRGRAPCSRLDVRYHPPMRRSHLPSLVALSTFVGAMVLSAQSPTPRDQLYALFERTWQWELSESPTSASALGDRRWNDRWDEVSLAAFDRRQAHRQAVLKELAAIP